MVAEGKLEVVASQVGEHVTNTKVVVCWYRVYFCTAVVTMVVQETVVGDIAVAGVGRQQAVADFDIVALLGCPGSTRLKP